LHAEKLTLILEWVDGGTGISHDAKSPRSSSILARSTTSGALSTQEMFALNPGNTLGCLNFSLPSGWPVSSQKSHFPVTGFQLATHISR
jgi:hypothetical protein